MEIKFSLPDFSEDKNNKIVSTFSPDTITVEDYQKLAIAAFIEYSSMLSGEYTFSTIAQQNQYRLYLLIKHCFNGLIPSEDQVAKIFKISLSGSKALIRNTKAAYYFELKEALLKTFKAVLANSYPKNKEDSYYQVAIRSSCLVNEMNHIMKIDHPDFEPIKRQNMNTQFYKVSETVYQRYR